MTYLDHAATHPLLPEVREAMLPWLGPPANPASAHRWGQKAAAALEHAREEVATLLARPANAVVFTSGATEANHLGIRGWYALKGGPVTVSAIEHPCVLAAARACGEVRVWRADRDGVVIPGEVTPVVALQAVNHELGTIQPVDDAWQRTQAAGAVLHVDAAQAAGKLDLRGMRGDSIALSAHKLGGPIGIGALVLMDGEPFPALLGGGAHERGRRAGTPNVAGAVGFAVACRVAIAELDARRARWQGLADRLRHGIRELGGEIVGQDGLPSTTTAVFSGVPGDLIVQMLDLRGIAVSSGAACASGSQEPSPVLIAIGHREPRGGVRISMGRDTTEEDVQRVLGGLRAVREMQ